MKSNNNIATYFWIVLFYLIILFSLIKLNEIFYSNCNIDYSEDDYYENIDDRAIAMSNNPGDA